jgi:hypothetical protein
MPIFEAIAAGSGETKFDRPDAYATTLCREAAMTERQIPAKHEIL